jgi:uncharacterized membrane protein
MRLHRWVNVILSWATGVSGTSRWFFLALWGAVASALAALPAHAEFSVCNQSLDVFNVAIGYEEDGEFQTEGWWSIGANRCVDVIRQPLMGRFVYVYAEDVFGQAVVEGAMPLCVGTSRFLIRGTGECWVRGHVEARFSEVDTLAQERWTMFLQAQ